MGGVKNPFGGGNIGTTEQVAGYTVGGGVGAVVAGGGGGEIGDKITDSIGLTNKGGDAALRAQQNAADQANATARQIYDQQRADAEPWRAAGMKALSGIESNNFMDNWQQQDPGYQARMAEGLKAVQGSAAARGLGNSGAALKSLSRYGQDYASNEYSKAYDRNYGRLSQLAGMGTAANAMNSQNAGVYGQQVAANQIGMGNAAASNQNAQSGRMGQALGQAVGIGGMLFSDLRLKKNILEVPHYELEDMKKHLKAYAFNYEKDIHGKGDWIGVMAQDLEKSKLGRTLVVEDENGNKTIDQNKVLSMFLATMAVA